MRRLILSATVLALLACDRPPEPELAIISPLYAARSSFGEFTFQEFEFVRVVDYSTRHIPSYDLRFGWGYEVQPGDTLEIIAAKFNQQDAADLRRDIAAEDIYQEVGCYPGAPAPCHGRHKFENMVRYLEPGQKLVIPFNSR